MNGYNQRTRWYDDPVREFESPLHRPAKWNEKPKKMLPPPSPPKPPKICWYCGARTQTKDQKAPDFHTRDHVIPRIKGGKEEGNLVPACKWCNSHKGSHSVEEFRARFAMLKNVPIEDVRFYGERMMGISLP